MIEDYSLELENAIYDTYLNFSSMDESLIIENELKQDFENQLLEEKRINSQLRSLIKTKDSEIESLKRVLSKKEKFNHVVEVQEKIEAILRKELANLKNVIKLQREMIEKQNQDSNVNSFNNLKHDYFENHLSEGKKSTKIELFDESLTSTITTNVFESRLPNKYLMEKNNKKIKSSVSSRSRRSYEYPTLSSILHRSPSKIKQRKFNCKKNLDSNNLPNKKQGKTFHRGTITI